MEECGNCGVTENINNGFCKDCEPEYIKLEPNEYQCCQCYDVHTFRDDSQTREDDVDYWCPVCREQNDRFCRG